MGRVLMGWVGFRPDHINLITADCHNCLESLLLYYIVLHYIISE